MSITGMMQAMQAITMRHQAQNMMFSANQNLMNLSNSVHANMTPQDIVQLQQKEIKFAAQAQQASWMMQIAMLMEEQAQRLIKASQDLKRRLMDAGATFV